MGCAINTSEENMKLKIVKFKSMRGRRFLFGLHDKYLFFLSWNGERIP